MTVHKSIAALERKLGSMRVGTKGLVIAVMHVAKTKTGRFVLRKTKRTNFKKVVDLTRASPAGIRTEIQKPSVKFVRVVRAFKVTRRTGTIGGRPYDKKSFDLSEVSKAVASKARVSAYGDDGTELVAEGGESEAAAGGGGGGGGEGEDSAADAGVGGARTKAKKTRRKSSSKKGSRRGKHRYRSKASRQRVRDEILGRRGRSSKRKRSMSEIRSSISNASSVSNGSRASASRLSGRGPRHLRVTGTLSSFDAETRMLKNCIKTLAREGPGKWKINFDSIRTDPAYAESYDPRVLLQKLQAMVHDQIDGRYQLTMA